MKNIVVDGFTYRISDPTVQATVTLTGIPSTTMKISTKGVCLNGFSLVVSNITVPSASATIPDTGPYNKTFESTAQHNTNDGLKVLLENDETSIIMATPKIPGQTPTPYPVSFKIIISYAGQNLVKEIT